MCQMSTFLKGELKAQFILRFSLHLCVSVKTKMCQISPKFGGLQEKVANIAPQLAKVCAKPPPSQNSTGMPRQTLTFRRHPSQALQCKHSQSIHCQSNNRLRNLVLFKFIESQLNRRPLFKLEFHKHTHANILANFVQTLAWFGCQ